MAIVLATVAKNEATYIAEWMAFHFLRGVDTIVVFDNDSTDGTTEIVQRFGQKYDVRMIPWPISPSISFKANPEPWQRQRF